MLPSAIHALPLLIAVMVRAVGATLVTQRLQVDLLCATDHWLISVLMLRIAEFLKLVVSEDKVLLVHSVPFCDI